jgi:hypothetical protein
VDFGFPPLCIILTAVANVHFQVLKADILDIRQEQITPHHGQEDEQVHKIAHCEKQAKLNGFIRHHQEVMT